MFASTKQTPVSGDSVNVVLMVSARQSQWAGSSRVGEFPGLGLMVSYTTRSAKRAGTGGVQLAGGFADNGDRP